MKDYEIDKEVFKFLTQKYVQSADSRQKSMGLQYMTAETHDLSWQLAIFIKQLMKE
jgi:hypothetical protein